MRGRPNHPRRPLDWIFSAPSNVGVLRVLKDSKQGMSGRAIAREAGFNHRAIARAVAKLETLGLIERQGSGKTQLIRLNFEHLLVKDVLLPMFADEKRTMGSLKLLKRGPEPDDEAPRPDGGIAAPLPVYRANGHRRLDARTCETVCAKCPWGLTMVTEIILDHWKPSKKRWRFETHCYGPKGCPSHKGRQAIPSSRPKGRDGLHGRRRGARKPGGIVAASGSQKSVESH